MERFQAQPANAPAPTGDVTLERRDGVATITVARPAKINAMGLATWQALYARVIAADADRSVAVIVLRGAGGHFGAGNDIAELSTFPGNVAAAEAFATAWADAIQAVADASKPVLMAIEGVCYGAALALSLAGDVRVASSTAVLSIPVAKLGALYLRSDFQRLVATIGMGQSKKLIFSSDTVGAEQALRIGLIDELFVDVEFEAGLQRLVDTILLRSPFTLQRSKEILRAIGGSDGASAGAGVFAGVAAHANASGGPGMITRETSESLAAFAKSTQCADFAEGISAFLARRPPRFR